MDNGDGSSRTAYRPPHHSSLSFPLIRGEDGRNAPPPPQSQCGPRPPTPQLGRAAVTPTVQRPARRPRRAVRRGPTGPVLLATLWGSWAHSVGEAREAQRLVPSHTARTRDEPGPWLSAFPDEPWVGHADGAGGAGRASQAQTEAWNWVVARTEPRVSLPALCSLPHRPSGRRWCRRRLSRANTGVPRGALTGQGPGLRARKATCSHSPLNRGAGPRGWGPHCRPPERPGPDLDLPGL